MKNRFYLPELVDETVILEGTEFHHLAHVLRVKPHDTVELINGQGTLAVARVEQLSRHQAILTIIEKTTTISSQKSLFVGLPFLRLEHMEWALEKGTELDATKFFLFPAERSEKKEISLNQFERFRHITIGAMKQSGRLYLPNIEIVSSLDLLLTMNAKILFGDLDPRAPLIKPMDDPQILFISGPEKGFSNLEIVKLHEHGFGVRLHRNVLRAETAPIVALSRLQ